MSKNLKIFASNLFEKPAPETENFLHAIIGYVSSKVPLPEYLFPRTGQTRRFRQQTRPFSQSILSRNLQKDNHKTNR